MSEANRNYACLTATPMCNLPLSLFNFILSLFDVHSNLSLNLHLFLPAAQRSAQELPVVESVSLTSCSAEGGEELLLGGTNFLPTSRVFFMERGSGIQVGLH